MALGRERARAAGSEALDAVGLRTSVALTHRVPDAVALLQRRLTGDHGHVDEEVVATGVGGDEAEAAVPVEARDHALAGPGRDCP